MDKMKEKIVLCTDPILQEYLKKNGVKTEVFDSILSREEKIKMLETLDEFAGHWFLDEKDKDYTIYRDISIGAGIHDEIMDFFQLLFHWAFLLDKSWNENKELILYQSDSCQMPEIVLRLIANCGGNIKRLNNRYPFLCYNKILSGKLNDNYTRLILNYTGVEKERSRGLIKDFKQAVQHFFSRLGFLLSKNKKKKFVYLYSMGNLAAHYKKYIENNNCNYGIIITANALGEICPQINKKNYFDRMFVWYKLAKENILFDSLRPYYWSGGFKRGGPYKKLVKNFQIYFENSFDKHFKFRNKIFGDFIKKTFTQFYLSNLRQFLKLIDYHYKKFSNPKIKIFLGEYIQLIPAQVITQLKKICLFSPRNIVLHNLYGAPAFYKKTSPFFKAIVVSGFDSSRYKKLGFGDKDIVIVTTPTIRSLRQQLCPFRTVKNIKKAKILVLPPFLGNLHSYRFTFETSYAVNYLTDLMSVCQELGAAQITIRPHPGALSRNKFNYTEEDFCKFIMNFYQPSWSLEIIVSDSDKNNLYNEVQKADLVVGSITGAVLEVLIWGRDFVFFDDGFGPFEGTKDDSVFHEKDSLIERLRTREELKEHLLNYQPINRELFFKRYFDSFRRKETLESYIDSFSIL